MVTLTLTPFIVLGINYKSVIGALWDYTCTPEIRLTLLNCFQINFQKITLTLTRLLVLNYKCNPGAPRVTPAENDKIQPKHGADEFWAQGVLGIPLVSANGSDQNVTTSALNHT